MNLSPKQKETLVKYYPELRTYFDLQEIKEKKDSDRAAMDNILSILISKIESVKGEKGADGITPVKGKDYYTQAEIDGIIKRIVEKTIPEEVLKKATPVKGIHYTDGKNGRDGVDGKKGDRGMDGIGVQGLKGDAGSPDTPKQIADKLNTLKGSVEMSVIKGIDVIDSRSKKIESGMQKIDGRMKLIDMRWHGGGLSKVSTDSTLTGNGTPSSPLSVVGGISSIGVETPVGAINGTNVGVSIVGNAVFAVVYVPLWIVLNQQTYFQNNGYTYANGIITIDSSIIPVTGSILRSINAGVAVTDYIYLTDSHWNILTDSSGNVLIV